MKAEIISTEQNEIYSILRNKLNHLANRQMFYMYFDNFIIESIQDFNKRNLPKWVIGYCLYKTKDIKITIESEPFDCLILNIVFAPPRDYTLSDKELIDKALKEMVEYNLGFKLDENENIIALLKIGLVKSYQDKSQNQQELLEQAKIATDDLLKRVMKK